MTVTDEEDTKSEEKFETNRRDVKGRECKQPPNNPCPTTNNKRKTRRGNEPDKEVDIKKEIPDNFNNNNVGNAKGRTTLNGDATEEEKISIKSEVDKEIKSEPEIIGNGNLESVSAGVMFGPTMLCYYKLCSSKLHAPFI